MESDYKDTQRGAGERKPPQTSQVKPDDDGPGGLDEHTPIIVTSSPDSSASIQFATDEYAPVEGDPNTRQGKPDLFLEKIQLDPPLTHNDGSAICFTPADDEMCVVEVSCEPAGQPPQLFTITGGGRNLQNSATVVNFNQNEYREDPQHFPPIEPNNGNERHGHAQRLVTRLQIFRLVGNQRILVHTCPVIAASGGRSQFRIFDSHKNT